MIHIDHVSLCYRIPKERLSGMKEFLVAAMKRQLQYQDFLALNDVSFDVQKGEILGIVGANGAGKSTLLKVIAGILKPTTGTVQLSGTIVPMLELGSGFDLELTGRENIFLNGAILGYSREFLTEKYDEILEFSELGDFIHSPLRNYSSGMVTRLAFSIATVVKPDILIVDEILSVGDAAFQKKSKNRMMELMNGGTTVLLVSHSSEQVTEICNKAVWLQKGKMMMYGEAGEVCRAYEETLQ